MEARLRELRKKEQEAQIWAQINEVEGLSEIERVQMFNDELIKILEEEACHTPTDGGNIRA